jgi:hypothetical protein
MFELAAVHGRFRSNGPDMDRSVSRFTSVSHSSTDSAQTGPPAVRGLSVSGPLDLNRPLVKKL